MGKAKQVNYYDTIYTGRNYHLVDPRKSIYAKMWLWAISFIPENSLVVDLGCGFGQFGRLLKGLKNVKYEGYDYSAYAVANAVTPGIELSNIFYLRPVADVVTMFEVLEHVEDLRLLETLNKGQRVIFSVPSFDSPAHVRHFKNKEEVYDRYENHVKFEAIATFNHPKFWVRKKWFCAVGNIR